MCKGKSWGRLDLREIKIAEEDEVTGEVNTGWITIKYDYLPKYCNHSKLQGRIEAKIRILHPELVRHSEAILGRSKDKVDTAATQTRILNSDKVVGDTQKSRNGCREEVNMQKIMHLQLRGQKREEKT